MAPAAAQQQQPPPPAYTTTPSSTSTTSGGMSRSSLSLPVAAQPDMVLAWEKDGFYAKQIHQQLKDVCEAAFGARRVELLGPEMEALGDLLYYGLTVCGGMETLGQEYGHLMFVEQRSAGRFLPLSRLRQAVLVGATVVCNYVSERILHREGWEGDYAQLLRPRRQRGQGQLQQPRERVGRRIEALQINDDAASSSSALAGGRGEGPPHAVLRATLARVQAALQSVAQAVSQFLTAHQGLLRSLLPESREAALRALARLHLMLFFFNGRFYTLATRLAGARSMFIREQQEGSRRTSYFVIGAFILLEMGLRALAGAVSAAARWLEGRRQARQQQEEQAQQAAQDGEPPTIKPSASFTRTLQTEARVPSGVNAAGGGSRGRSWSVASDGGLGGPRASGGGGVDEQKKCALCMSRRRAPAVTPCGHCFCWRCILAWCAEQPECPLCRAKVLPQSIIHVVNLGFPGDGDWGGGGGGSASSVG